jgi:hypothetical protein
VVYYLWSAVPWSIIRGACSRGVLSVERVPVDVEAVHGDEVSVARLDGHAQVLGLDVAHVYLLMLQAPVPTVHLYNTQNIELPPLVHLYNTENIELSPPGRPHAAGARPHCPPLQHPEHRVTSPRLQHGEHSYLPLSTSTTRRTYSYLPSSTTWRTYSYLPLSTSTTRRT